MKDTAKLAIMQTLMVIPLIMNKFARRKFLNEETPEILKIFLFSFPNLLEAIVGVMFLTIFGLILNGRWLSSRFSVNEPLVYLFALGLAGVFVVTQELNIYNRRGDNVSDLNDVIFSIIGLIIASIILLIMRPRYSRD